MHEVSRFRQGNAFREAGGKWSTFIIWAKNTFTLGRSDYQRQYEPILYGWPEGATRHWCAVIETRAMSGKSKSRTRTICTQR
jgi:DNA modification methylase